MDVAGGEQVLEGAEVEAVAVRQSPVQVEQQRPLRHPHDRRQLARQELVEGRGRGLLWMAWSLPAGLSNGARRQVPVTASAALSR